MIVNKYNNGSGGGSGERGPQGPVGPKGDSGYTPYIQNDEWYINGESTGVPATGPQGPQGPAGGGAGGDSNVLKSVSATPENLGIGDGISKTEEETYEDYENHDVSEWDGPFCIENIEGMVSPDAIYFSTLSGLVINYEWDEWHEDTQETIRRSSIATLSLIYDSANDSWNVDYNDPDGGLNMSQESGNYYFNAMDFSFHVDPASEHDIPLRFDYSYNNNPCFEKGDCEGGYSIKVEKTRPKSNGMWIWKTNPEWGRWIGYRPNYGIGNSETDGVFLVYDYLPQEIDGQKIAKLSYMGGGYGNNKYLYFNFSEMRMETHMSEDASSSTEDIIYPNAETEIGNFGIGNMRIYWDTENKFIRFRADFNTVQEPISTTLEGEGLECLVKNDNYQFDFQDSIADGMPKWDNNGKIVGRTYSLQTKQVFVNNSQWNNYLQILHSGDSNFPNRIWVPTTGGNSGQVLVSNGQDSAPSWKSMIKAVKITSAAYEALVQAGTTDPNTLYLIDDNE